MKRLCEKMKKKLIKQRKESSTDPPEQLKELIELANLVPFDVSIDRVSDSGIESVYLKQGKHYNEYWKNNFDSEWNNYYLSSYPKLRKYLSDIAKTNGLKWMEAFNRFKIIRDFMILFVEIAKKYQDEIKIGEKIRDYSSHESITPENRVAVESELDSVAESLKDNFNITYPAYDIAEENRTNFYRRFDIPSKAQNRYLGEELLNTAINFISLTVDDNHLAHLSFGKFIDAIENTDLTRLRKCKKCLKLIWAYRSNTFYCSKECRNAFNSEKARRDPKRNKIIKKQRRKNYQYNKRLKRKKERK